MYHRSILPNGLKIVCETIPYVHSVSIGFWVACGSRNEAANEEGMSHFIEHMAFKGTKNRTAKEIAETIDAVGGHLNAFTTKEYTCFYAKVLDQHFNLGMQLLADMIIDPLFAEEDLIKERNVIEEEIKSYEDSPDELVHDLLAESLMTGHPLGHPVLGTPETLRGFTRESVVDYWQRFYTPGNACLAVAGNIDIDQVVAEAERWWSRLSGTTPSLVDVTAWDRQRIAIRQKDTEQVNLCIGSEGVSRTHEDKYAMLVLDSILGGSVSSRLFQELREERGLVYSTGSSHGAYRDTGIFSVYAGTSMSNFNQVVSIIRQQMDQLREFPVREEELQRAKEQLKGNLWLSLENTSNRMSRLAKSEMFYGHLLTPEEVVARIEGVTRDDVLAMAQRTFDLDRLVLAAIGPFPKDLPKEIENWNR